ncbi:Putative Serine/threonine protein kinase [Rhizopus microsporus]|nr:Putative Serine/threonine protein kinase [Rhizopus microsporus]
MVSFNKQDIEIITKLTGYTFDTPTTLEGTDNVAIAYGQRNRDKLPVVVKLSRQPLRLEREYHITQRLYREVSSRDLLCKPVDKLTLPNGLSAFIFEDYGKNLLDLATSSELNAKMMRSLLSGFNVIHTSDMHQAVPKALQDHHPILILDIPPKPSGFILHQIQSVVDDPECELHIILLYTPSTEGHKVAAEATGSASDRRGRLVKMAKPARRAKLLRLFEIVMDEKKPRNPISSLTPVIATRMKDYFSPDELKLYSKQSVLIAEDNFVARKLLKQQLEKLGFTVETASDGEEAIEIYKQKPPNYFCLAFFDHHMPKCDGVEATKRIRALEKQTGCRLPIIALTADIQSSAKQICVEAGMDDYLTKPLIPKNLAATLRQLQPSIQKVHYDTPTSSIPSSPSESLTSSSL